jgi:hypothetical protein
METHPNIDPLKIAGKVIGLHPDVSKRYKIEVFSVPEVLSYIDETSGDEMKRIGYVCRYSVKFNFKGAGRKVVSYKINSMEVESAINPEIKLAKTITTWLETRAETILAENLYDIIMSWGDKNQNDN